MSVYEVRPELKVYRCPAKYPAACRRGIHFGKRADAEAYVAREERKHDRLRAEIRASVVQSIEEAEALMAQGTIDLAAERMLGNLVWGGLNTLEQYYNATEPETTPLLQRYERARTFVLRHTQQRFEQTYGTAQLNQTQRDLLWERAQRGRDPEKRYAKIAREYLEIANAI